MPSLDLSKFHFLILNETFQPFTLDTSTAKSLVKLFKNQLELYPYLAKFDIRAGPSSLSLGWFPGNPKAHFSYPELILSLLMKGLYNLISSN